MLSGIYKIIHLDSGKVYIGSTNNLTLREQQHFSSLRLGYHRNRYLQRSFNKYGEKRFRFEVIEYCVIQNLTEREQHWIDVTKNLYNLRTEVVESNLGIKWTDDAKKKQSEILKKCALNIGKFGKDNATSIPVLQFDLNGEFINRFECVKEAARLTKINRGNIATARNNLKTAGGFIWAFEDDSHKVFEMLEWLHRPHHNLGRRLTEKHKNKISNSGIGFYDRLNDMQISIIKANFKLNSPTNGRDLAKLFKVSEGLVSFIKHNKRRTKCLS